VRIWCIKKIMLIRKKWSEVPWTIYMVILQRFISKTISWKMERSAWYLLARAV
jgi:hypothetical protein